MTTSSRFAELAEELRRASGTTKQSVIANACGVSQPSVNDWLNGRKRPRPLALIRLCEFLNLELSQISRIAGYNPATLAGLSSKAVVGNPDSSQLLRDLMPALRQARFRGSPSVAITMADSLVAESRRLIESCGENESKLVSSQFLPFALAEKARILCETMQGESIRAEVELIYRQIMFAANSSKDSSLQGLAYTIRGGLSYSLGLHRKSLQDHARAITLVQERSWKAEALRAASIASSSIGDVATFRHYKNLIKSFLDQNRDTSLTAFLLEGLARAESRFNPDSAWETLNAASEACNSKSETVEFSALHRVQIARSKCAILADSGRYNRNEIERIGTDGITVANACGYYRYAAEIGRCLDKV